MFDRNKTVWLEVAACSLIMGLVPIGIKKVTGSPVNIGTARLAVALPFFLFMPGIVSKIRALKKKDFPALFLIGFLFFLHWALYFQSIKSANPTMAVLGLSTYGIHLMLLSLLFLKRRPRLVDLVALGLAFGGVLLIVPEFSLHNEDSYGLLLGIGGGFCFAALPVLHKKNSHVDDLVRTLMMMATALVLFLASSATEPWTLEPRQDWPWLLFLGVLGTFVSHSLWTRVSTFLAPNLTSILYYLFIPMAMFWDWFLLSEPANINKILGGAMIIVGGILSVAKSSRE